MTMTNIKRTKPLILCSVKYLEFDSIIDDRQGNFRKTIPGNLLELAEKETLVKSNVKR